MNRKNAIIEVLNELDETSLINVWNNYCSENHSTEDTIFHNSEFEINEQLSGREPFSILQGVDSYNSADEYFVLGIYGLKSFNDVDDIIEKSDLANAILRSESILTDAVEEEEWGELLMGVFEEYLDDLNIPTEIIEKYDISADDLLTQEWEDILNNLDEE